MNADTDRKKVYFQFIFPLLVTIMVLVVFFRDISLRDIGVNFLKIPVSYLAAFIILSFAATFLRAYKYHILLSRKLSFKDVFLITLVRNFSVDLLPARTAALIFYTWLTKKKGLSVEEGASSFVVSVFYDGLALAFMLSGLVFFLETGHHNRLAIYTGMGIVFTLSVVMIFFAHHITGLILGIGFVHRFSWIMKRLGAVDFYLRNHKSNRERLWLFLLSLAVRLLKYIFIYILFEGVIQIGFGLQPFSLFSFGLAGTEMSSLLPIQGLGGFGTWELAFTYIFKALGITAANIKTAGFVIHITTQVFEYSIGLAAFVYLFMNKKSTGKTG